MREFLRTARTSKFRQNQILENVQRFAFYVYRLIEDIGRIDPSSNCRFQQRSTNQPLMLMGSLLLLVLLNVKHYSALQCLQCFLYCIDVRERMK